MLLGCSATPIDGTEEQEELGAVGQSVIIDPAAAKYLGGGISVMADTATKAVRKPAVNIDAAWRTVGHQTFTSTSLELTDARSLTSSIRLEVGASAGAQLTDLVKLEPSLAIDLSADVKLSSTFVTLMAVADYEYATVGESEVSLKSSVFDDPLVQETVGGKSVFSPTLFRKVYGDSFVSRAVLGERLYVIYQSEIIDRALTTRAEVSAAMKANVGDLLSASASASLTAAQKATLLNTRMRATYFSTGSCITQSLVDSPEAVKAAYKDFAACVVAKQSTPAAEFTVLEEEVTSYGPYLDGYVAVEETAKRLAAWRALFAKIEVVEEMSNDGVISHDCSLAKEAIVAEMQACTDNQVACRYPNDADYPELVDIWDDFVTAPQYRARTRRQTSALSQPIGVWRPLVDEGQSASDNDLYAMDQLAMSLSTGRDQAWSIRYRGHDTSEGWLDFKQDGAASGREAFGKLNGFSAILKGMPSKYHVRYRGRLYGNTWTPWVADGETAGSGGAGPALTGYQVQVVNALTGLSSALNGNASKSQTVPGGSPLMLKGSSKHADQFFVSLVQADASWNVIGTEVSAWLSAAEIQQLRAGTFDARAFAIARGLPINPGTYYRIKVAVGAPWIERVILVQT